MTEIWRMNAVEVHDLLKQRKLSALEVLESCITRVEEIDCKINALPERCFDRARALASEIDKSPSKGP